MMDSIWTELSLLSVAILLAAAFFTSMIHGATGIAGGFLLAVVAAPILGMKLVIPILSITLLISHGSRALLNMRQFDKTAYFSISIPALPCIIIAALVYGKLSGTTIAFVLGTVVLLSVPARRWAKANELKTTKYGLHTAGAIYGGIAGLSIGPGMLLMPVLLGYGLGRQAFVATLAAIALTTNVVRSSVYGASDLLTIPYVLLAILIGIATIPGAWIGRSILRRITDERHATAVEWLVLLGGLNFYWMGLRTMG